MILMPLYYQVIRHQDPVATGLLAAPTGLGAALAMRASAALTDRIGSGKTALLGGLLTAIATIPFTFIGPATSYTTLSLAMAVRGFGIGLCMMPAMTAAYRAIPPAKISDGTVQLSVLMRLGGSLGTAIFTIVLQHGLNAAAGSGAGASAFAAAFRWALGAAVVALLPAIVLAIAEARPRGTASQVPEPGAARPEAASRSDARSAR
jgi:MFS family permease